MKKAHSLTGKARALHPGKWYTGSQEGGEGNLEMPKDLTWLEWKVYFEAEERDYWKDRKYNW